MSLRARRIEETTTLPDGREVTIDIGLARDDYIARSEETTVTAELRHGSEVLAVVNTLLDPDDDSEALELARTLAERLGSGELEPTAAAVESISDGVR